MWKRPSGAPDDVLTTTDVLDRMKKLGATIVRQTLAAHLKEELPHMPRKTHLRGYAKLFGTRVGEPAVCSLVSVGLLEDWAADLVLVAYQLIDAGCAPEDLLAALGQMAANDDSVIVFPAPGSDARMAKAMRDAALARRDQLLDRQNAMSTVHLRSVASE